MGRFLIIFVPISRLRAIRFGPPGPPRDKPFVRLLDVGSKMLPVHLSAFWLRLSANLAEVLLAPSLVRAKTVYGSMKMRVAIFAEIRN